MLLLLLLSADCTETNGRANVGVHHLSSSPVVPGIRPSLSLTDHWMLSIFTKILVAKLSPLQELLVQQQPPSSSALSPASNSYQAHTRNITFPGRTMHQHRLGGEQRLAQPIFWVCGILNPLIRKNPGRKPPWRKPLN